MKIAFFHPALMDYRINFFSMLADKYDVTFVFTKHGFGQGGVPENHLNIPDNWKSKVVKTNTFLRNIDIGMYFNLIV